jgi:hypothetical protein
MKAAAKVKNRPREAPERKLRLRSLDDIERRTNAAEWTIDPRDS